MTEYTMRRDMIDVTSMNRPDTTWKVVDAAGHEHRWYVDGKSAGHYDPSAHHELPTLVWVTTGAGHYPDGSEYDVGHYECRECGEEVEHPRSTSDSFTQRIPFGVITCEIDGVPVTREQFEKSYAEEYGEPAPGAGG